MTRPAAVAAHLGDYEEVAAKSPELVKALNDIGRIARRLAHTTAAGKRPKPARSPQTTDAP